MAIFAIGDVQGCYDELLRLVERIQFDPARDHLWFAGDLVNRGGKSLEVLRFVKSLGDRAVVVLGNHDLHLIAEGIKKPERQQRRNAELQAVLTAPDGPELLHWLRHRKLLHHDEQLNFVLVHAGLSGQWTLSIALAQARAVERALQGDQPEQFLERMYGNKPKAWTRELKGLMRLRAAVNVLTRMRYCNVRGEIAFEAKGMPGTQPNGYYPWFEVPGHKPRRFRVVCGHWSALGRFQGMGVYGIDTGCVWGGALTALRIDIDQPEFCSVPSGRPKSATDAD